MNPLNLTKLTFSLLLLIAAGACSKKDSIPPPPSNQPPAQAPEPIALFSVTNTDMRAPVKIKFKNNSQHADTYLWEFSDGTTSTEKEPEKIFTEAGTFAVKLIATGAAGKTNSKASSVTIEDIPNFFHITKISITAAQLDGNGDGNGAFSISDHDPDVYVQLASGMTQFQTPIVQDAHALSQLSWTTDYSFHLRQRRNIIIQMFDKDNFSPDDRMGGIVLNPADYMTIDKRYPREITATENGVSFKLQVSWESVPL